MTKRTCQCGKRKVVEYHHNYCSQLCYGKFHRQVTFTIPGKSNVSKVEDKSYQQSLLRDDKLTKLLKKANYKKTIQ